MNLRFLRMHLEWNRARNVEVVAAAVGERDGTARFGGTGDSLAFEVGQGDQTVEVRSVRSLVERTGLTRPTVVKMDVEGQATAALRGRGDLLGGDLVLLISVHDRSLHQECAALLETRGFRLFPSRAMAARLADPTAEWGGDHDLLAVGPDRGIDEAVIRSLPLFAGA